MRRNKEKERERGRYIQLWWLTTFKRAFTSRRSSLQCLTFFMSCQLDISLDMLHCFVIFQILSILTHLTIFLVQSTLVLKKIIMCFLFIFLKFTPSLHVRLDPSLLFPLELDLDLMREYYCWYNQMIFFFFLNMYKWCVQTWNDVAWRKRGHV